MAEASQENTILDTRTRMGLFCRIFRFIENNSLDEIEDTFELLHPEQRINIINSSIRGFLPLYLAVNLNKVEISRYLLELSLLQGSRVIAKHWRTCNHPLIAAIKVGNQELIELILQHLPDINDTLNGAYSPLMMATYLGIKNSVKLIVAKGADINRTCFRRRTPLMESTNNSHICRFLLSKGAEVHKKDREGFTALHLAVARQDTKSVIYLVNAGADVRIRSHEGLTPLMWAAINQDELLFKYLVQQPGCSNLDMIEALEIFNACFIFDQKSDIKPWIEALQFRRGANVPKICPILTHEVLDYSSEFTTEIELENLQGKPLNFAYQSILVVERILGRNNRLNLQLFLQTALIAKNGNNIHKFRQLIDYIKDYCQETPIFFVAPNLSTFESLFGELSKDIDPKTFWEYGAFSIFKIIAQTALKMWAQIKDHVARHPFFVEKYHSEIVNTFLRMTSTIKTCNFSQYLGQFREVVTKVVREDLRVVSHQSILHCAIKMMRTQPGGSVELIEILLESGANANCKDYFGWTPIMFAVKHVPKDILNKVLALLLRNGALPLM